MIKDVRIEVVYNKIPRLNAEMREKARRAVGKTVFDIQASAMNDCPVDTGAMKNSHYVSTSWGESDYSEAQSRARSANPKVEFVDEAKPKVKRGQIVANTGPSVKYAIYVHEGTRNRPGNAYLRRAADVKRKDFIAAMREIAR